MTLPIEITFGLEPRRIGKIYQHSIKCMKDVSPFLGVNYGKILSLQSVSMCCEALHHLRFSQYLDYFFNKQWN